MESTDGNELMTIQEAKALKGVGAQSIYYAIERGWIQRVFIYGKPFLVRSTVERYEPRKYSGKRDK